MINPIHSLSDFIQLDQDIQVKEYLSDLSPRDKLWDTHKIYSQKIAEFYKAADNEPYFNRISNCANYLLFGLKDVGEEDPLLKLAAAHFCHVPQCQLCNWLRSRMWRRRFFKILPKMLTDLGEGYQFIFVTLTVRNCPLQNLREQLKEMSAAWKRLSERKDFLTFKAFTRTTEVTRNYDIYYHGSSVPQFIGRMGTRKYYDWLYQFLSAGGDKNLVQIYPTKEAHPHYHALLLVEDAYFDKNQSKYWQHKRWLDEWQSALRVDYKPSVHVKAVKTFDVIPQEISIQDIINLSLETDFDIPDVLLKKSLDSPSPLKDISSSLIKSVLETLKYCVKPADIIGEIVTHPCSDGFDNVKWLQEFTDQVYRTRKIATGGLFKFYLKDLESEKETDADFLGDRSEGDFLGIEYFFQWHNQVQKYKLKSVNTFDVDEKNDKVKEKHEFRQARKDKLNKFFNGG